MMGGMVEPQQQPGFEATVTEDSNVPVIGAPSGWPAGTQVVGRFVVNSALGRGSSGEVLAVQDLSLDREVAMKVLRGAGGPAIARFMREARITAKLDHPCIPPVHTLEFLPDGGLLFTMRRLDGMTLGEAIRRTAGGEAVPAVATVNAVVSLGLRICEALSRAHFLGIVHRDVKPDNIMLGGHGEVALVDWGECRLLAEPDTGPAGSTVGTPAYMSPEQARGECADVRSDVYALGATLFHVLTRQHPTWDADPARFWEKKRAGILDLLPPMAASRVPRPLLAILHRALLARPDQRYASAGDFAADLERFQAGQAVAAYQESHVERVLRWTHRHLQGLLIAAGMLAVCLAAGGALWRDHLRQLADWGPPVLLETFADDSWRQRWIEEYPGQWEVDGGRLLSRDAGRSSLVLSRPLSGAVAIEYEGEMLAGARPGDLSIIWSEEPEVGKVWKESEKRGFMIQAGAFDNYFCAIYRWPEGARIDQRPFRLIPGVRHRFRVELDGRRIGMWIDGVRVLEAEERLPITTGRLSFYAYYPDKAFDDVRVYQKRLPQMTSVLAIGEAFLRKQQPVHAADAFREVAESQPDTALAVEARYLQGLALREVPDLGASLQVWQDLPPGEQADRVAGHLLDQLVAKGQFVEACRILADLYRRSPLVRSQLRAQWQTWALQGYRAGIASHDVQAATALIEAKLRLFPEHEGSDLECANLMLNLGRSKEVVDRFPLEVVPCCRALCIQGRAEEVMTRFADATGSLGFARSALGQFEETLADPRVAAESKVWALCHMGKLDAAAALDPMAPQVLLRQGRAEEVLRLQSGPAQRSAAFAALGRWDEAIALPENRTAEEVRKILGRSDPLAGGDNPFIEHLDWRLVRLTAIGELTLRDALLAQAESLWPNWGDWLTRFVIVPLVRGDRDLLRQRMETARLEGRRGGGQRPYHLANFVLGHSDANSFTLAPCAGEADLWLAVGQALRAELAGDDKAICQAWRSYRELPWHRRITGDCLPQVALEALSERRIIESSGDGHGF